MDFSPSLEATAGYNHLASSGMVDVTSPLAAESDGGTTFTCNVPVPQPNLEGLPDKIAFKVALSHSYPFGKVEFLPLDETLEGFPHQFWVGQRNLCLKRSNDYPFSAKLRLASYAQSACEWVAAAAQRTLLEDGQPWELPDFRTKQGILAPSVLFLESATSFPSWAGMVGRVGTVTLAPQAMTRNVVAIRFRADTSHAIEYAVSSSYCDADRATTEEFAFLSSLIFTRHRPARTFGELGELCARDGVDLWQCLSRAVRRTPGDYHYLLLGCPIPRVVGKDAVEVHWQPIALSSDLVAAARVDMNGWRPVSGNDIAPERLKRTLRKLDVPWSASVNVGGDRLLVRGALAPPVRAKRVCILGCGALGSVVADHLARGGIGGLTLFDDERVEHGNLSRHVLTAEDVGRCKASALGCRLSGLHPSSEIRAFDERLPLSSVDSTKSEARASIDRADVLIDCTTDGAAFEWASQLGRAAGKTVIHAYLNARARMLTICSSGRHASCKKVARALLSDIVQRVTPFSITEYDPDDLEAELGAGCWSATFPARGSDIAALVTAALPVLEHLIGRERQSRGTAVVVRRRDTEIPFPMQPLIEIVWIRDYR